MLSPRSNIRPTSSTPRSTGLNAGTGGKTSLNEAASTTPTLAVATPELLSFSTQTHAIANFQPSTGYGLFDASYDANRQELLITVRCAFRFLAGQAGNFQDCDPAELAWDDDSKGNWRQGFIEVMENRWSGQHAFRCTQPGLEGLRASVRVDVIESDKDWHFRLDVTRIPKGEWTGSSVSSHPGSGVERNFATLDSEDLTQTPKGGSEGQYGGVHEFGHMIGLDDEYGTGTDVAHRTLVKDALGTEISKGKSDDVMSCANRVGKQHYVTYLEALKKATGVEEWIFEGR